MHYRKIFCKPIAEYFDYLEKIRPWFNSERADCDQLAKVKRHLKEHGEAIYNRAGSPAMYIAHDLTTLDMKKFVAKAWEGIGIWQG